MKGPEPASAHESTDALCRASLALAMRGDGATALERLGAALHAQDRTPQDVVPLIEALTTVCAWTGLHDRALDLVVPVTEEPLPPAILGRVLLETGFLFPSEQAAHQRRALAELTIAGDDKGRALAMIHLAFPDTTLLPGVDHRLRLCDAAEALGLELQEDEVVLRARGVRGALEGYAGRTDDAATSLRTVWERVDTSSARLVTLCGTAMMNHAFLLIALGDFAGADDVVAAADIRFLGARHRWFLDVTKAAAMIHRGHYREALTIVESIPSTSDELSAFVTVMKASALIELSPRTLESDLADEVDMLEAESMMLGWLGRITQTDVRSARGEPRPHRDLAPTLRRLAPSQPRLGWDGVALALARYAPDEAADTLADMWDFWPTGPRATTQRAFVETMLGMRDPYPSYMEIAEQYVAHGELMPAAEALRLASDAARADANPLRRTGLRANTSCELMPSTASPRSCASDECAESPAVRRSR